MTVHQTKDIILTWIESCETGEQCDLILEIIGRFINDRFEGHVKPETLSDVKAELYRSLKDQRHLIVWHYNPMGIYDAPTLLLNYK